MNKNNSTGNEKDIKIKGIIAIVFVILASMITIYLGERIVNLINTPGYEKPVITYCKALKTADYKELMKLFPDYLTKELDEKASNAATPDYQVEFMKSLGPKTKNITYQVTNQIKASKADLLEAQDVIATKYSAKVELKEGYCLHIRLTIKDDKGSREEAVIIYVVKIGSSWYVPDLECLPELS